MSFFYSDLLLDVYLEKSCNSSVNDSVNIDRSLNATASFRNMKKNFDTLVGRCNDNPHIYQVSDELFQTYLSAMLPVQQKVGQDFGRSGDGNVSCDSFIDPGVTCTGGKASHKRAKD
eukprot:Awhi_evm1s7882